MTCAQIPATLACCGVWCPAPNSLRGFGRVLDCQSFEKYSQKALYYQSFDRSKPSVSPPVLRFAEHGRFSSILVSPCRATSPLTRILQRFLLSMSITSTKSSPAALACPVYTHTGIGRRATFPRTIGFVRANLEHRRRFGAKSAREK